MRRAMLLLAAFGLIGLLWAAEPMSGTWKLNVAKSKYPPSIEAPPKEMTQVFRRLKGNQGEFSQTGTRTDGTPIAVKYIAPRQGGVVKTQTVQLEGIYIVLTRVDSRNAITTYMEDGKQVAVIQSVVSKDGKTLTQTTKVTDDQGKTIEQMEVFDKQ